MKRSTECATGCPNHHVSRRKLIGKLKRVIVQHVTEHVDQPVADFFFCMDFSLWVCIALAVTCVDVASRQRKILLPRT